MYQSKYREQIRINSDDRQGTSSDRGHSLKSKWKWYCLARKEFHGTLKASVYVQNVNGYDQLKYIIMLKSVHFYHKTLTKRLATEMVQVTLKPSHPYKSIVLQTATSNLSTETQI